MLAGRFELQDLLGRGGMGAVYKARDRALDETIAIKLMRPEFAENPLMAERFKSEIRLARRVRHRHVCAIHDYGEVDGTLFITMELVEGSDLKRLVQKRGPLPRDEAWTLALQIAEGLQAVHEAGIVHRDLKPSNVVVGTDGVARLMDFGIAKRQQGEGRAITGTGDIVGTPEYMSPEQAQGRPLDARSDVYALGVLTYELFTGQLPFRGDTPISTILQHIQAPPPLDGPPAAGIPRPLRDVLRRALAKDPAQRYADARAFKEALAFARLAPEPPARRATGPLVAAALLGALLVAGLLLVRAKTADRQPALPPSAASATPPPAPTPEPKTEVRATVAPAPPATPAPRPVRSAAPTAAPVKAPAPPAVTLAARPGTLHVVVRPWAEVTVDGRVVGETPLGALSLAAGEHVVRLQHPAWEAVERRVRLEPGQTLRLVVDLAAEGRRRRP